MRSSSSLFFTLALVTIISPPISASEYQGSRHRTLECQSANVWDDGFVMSFDVESYQPGAKPQIDAKLFALVPLWRKQLVYAGPMLQQRVESGQACDFELIDKMQGPQSRIRFQIDGNRYPVTLEKFNGVRPEKWAELECQPELLELLATFCGLPE